MNKFDSIIDSIIFYTGLVVLGVIFLMITTNIHEMF